MFKRLFGSKRSEGKNAGFEIEYDEDETTSEFIRDMQTNMIRLIAYAESADTTLQREVAERLANEAVQNDRQKQIVECGGLKLLIPLIKSTDREVRRLAAHALANLSVDASNQVRMADEGAIDLLIDLLEFDYELAQRQSAKALANLGVNKENKRKIAECGAIPKLVLLINTSNYISVKIEAIAAIANLAVNDSNEAELIQAGVLKPIIDGARLAMDEMTEYGTKLSGDPNENYEELAAQCARCLRNLSVKPNNRSRIIDEGGLREIQRMLSSATTDRIASQARRALKNLDGRKDKSSKK